MVKFKAGILSSPVLHPINLPLPSTKEYSKFRLLYKWVVSNANANCLAAIGYCESVNTTFTQSDVFVIFFQSSISDVYITPIP